MPGSHLNNLRYALLRKGVVFLKGEDMKYNIIMNSLKEKKFYRKLLFAFLTTVVVLILFSTIALYFYFRAAMLENIKKTNNNIVAQISYGKEYMDNQASNLGKTLLSSNYMLAALTSRQYDPLAVSKALNELTTLTIADSNIESIYIYNAHTQTFTTSNFGEFVLKNQFFDTEAVDILKNFQVKDVGRVFSREVITHYGTTHVYSYVYLLNGETDNNENSAIVINYKVDYLTDMIKNLSMLGNHEKNEIIVLDEKGSVVNTTNKDQFLKDYSDYSYVKTMMSSKKLLATWVGRNENGERYVFTFYQPVNDPWIFISMVPYQQVYGEIRKLAVCFSMIVVFVLVAAFFSSYFVSRRLYHPIEKMSAHINHKSNLKNKEGKNELEMVLDAFDNVYDTARKLESTSRSNKLKLKNACIRSIVTGEWNIREQNTLQECEKYGISQLIESNSLKALFYLKIDDYHLLKEKFIGTELETIHFAVINVVNEIIGEKYENWGCDLKGGKFCFIINIAEKEKAQFCPSARECAQKARSWLRKYMDIGISVIIGEPEEVSQSMHQNYETVLELEKYTFIYGNGSILDYFYFDQIDNEYYTVEWKQEKALAEAIKMGKKDRADTVYMEISDESVKHDYNNIINTYFYLAYALYNDCWMSIDKEKENFASIFMPFIGGIASMRSKQEVDTAFQGLFRRIIEFYSEINSKKNGDLVEDVKKIIRENYADKGICLNEIAQKLGKSPSYVGRMFKENTNKSVSEYILDIRMNEIKQLLDTTDFPLNQIIESVGLEKTNYFYTLFRKYFGVTVSAYDRGKQKNM